jgi:gamma-glutamyltranspeptidase/glutathione hydrolase
VHRCDSPGCAGTGPRATFATGRGHAAVTPHHLATAAALDIMKGGGNAVDAAIAANAVLGMVDPTTCGIGGDLLALVHSPGRPAPDALNSSGRGGSGLDATALRAAGHRTVPLRSQAAVTVPGCVDGWEALAGRFGTKPLAELLAPAIRLGEEGFEVSAELADALHRIHRLVAGQPSAPELFPEGRPPAPGQALTRPRLAATLADVADRGRQAFYSGRIATLIADATGGLISREDLSANRADWVDPIGLGVFGQTAWTLPPNSQGYLILAAAWLLEHLAPPTDPADAAFHHAVVEAYRAVAWERDRLVCDPSRASLSPESLVDPARLQSRLGAIRPDRPAGWPHSPARGGDTAFLCAVDAAGCGVSLIQSNYSGIGSGISAGDSGIWLHNRGACFSLDRGHPNEAAPGRRPMTTLSPTLWTREDRLSLLLGTRGGYQQPQYLLQVAALHLLAGLDLNSAQATPRWQMDDRPDGAPSAILTEAGMPEDVVVGLASRGHLVSRGPELPAAWGPVSVISIAADGCRLAAADPRVTTAAAGAD